MCFSQSEHNILLIIKPLNTFSTGLNFYLSRHGKRLYAYVSRCDWIHFYFSIRIFVSVWSFTERTEWLSDGFGYEVFRTQQNKLKVTHFERLAIKLIAESVMLIHIPIRMQAACVNRFNSSTHFSTYSCVMWLCDCVSHSFSWINSHALIQSFEIGSETESRRKEFTTPLALPYIQIQTEPTEAIYSNILQRAILSTDFLFACLCCTNYKTKQKPSSDHLYLWIRNNKRKADKKDRRPSLCLRSAYYCSSKIIR